MGPGLLESVYAAALTIELLEKGLTVRREVPVPVYYKERKLELGFRLDLLVNDKVIVEIKSIEAILPVHHKQVLTYLKVHNCKLGILVNFNCDVIKDNIYRKVNNL